MEESGNEGTASLFSQFVIGGNGNTYRLERSNGERATYYDPKTGNRITVHRDDANT